MFALTHIFRESGRFFKALVFVPRSEVIMRNDVPGSVVQQNSLFELSILTCFKPLECRPVVLQFL